MRVLVIHPTGAFGGASKSILEAQNHLRCSGVSTEVISVVGTSLDQFRSHGYTSIPISHISQFDNTKYGHYRGFRWLITLREFFYYLSSRRVIKKVVKRGKYDVIHLNEVTLLPWAKMIRRMSDARIIVHVRSLQRSSSGDCRTRWFLDMLNNDVDRIVAIDETVRRTLPKDLSVSVIHNSMRVVPQRTQFNIARKRFRVAIIGVLLKLKGIYEFLRAAKILVQEKGYDIEFYIVGDNARKLSGLKAAILKRLELAHDVRGDIEEFVNKYSLQNNVVLTGFVEDVQSIYADLDVLCFPSYLNAAGRPVFEAAYFGVPSIVAVRDPPPDTIVHGKTGLCIDEPDSELLASAIERLYLDRKELNFLGGNARELAYRHFNVEINAESLLAVYKDSLS